jgi:hypothetical protein
MEIECPNCGKVYPSVDLSKEWENELSTRGGRVKSECVVCKALLVIGRCLTCDSQDVHLRSECDVEKGSFRCPEHKNSGPVGRSESSGGDLTFKASDSCQDSAQSSEAAVRQQPSEKTPTVKKQLSQSVFETTALPALPDDVADLPDPSTVDRLSGIEKVLASISKHLNALPNQNNQSVTNEDIEGRINEVTKTLRNIDTRLEKLEVTTKQDIRSRLDEVSNSVQNTLSNSVNKLNNSLSQLLENPILDQKLMPSLDGDGSSVKVPNESPWEPVAQLVVDLLNSSSMTKTLNEIIPALNKVESVDKRFRKYVASTLKDIRCDMLGQLGGDGSRFEWHSIPKGINGELRRLEGQLSQKLIEEVKELSGGSRLKSSPGRRTESDAKQQAESSVPDNLAAIVCETLAFHPEEVEKAKEVFESGTAARLVKDLPALFNFLEDKRRHWTTRAETSPEPDEHAPEVAGNYEATYQEVARVLKEFDQKFHSWQMANHIRRIPESDSPEFNHRYHFPVTTELTDDRDKHRLIKKVEHYGYVFNDGKHEIVLQKAEVVVWNCPDV